MMLEGIRKCIFFIVVLCECETRIRSMPVNSLFPHRVGVEAAAHDSYLVHPFTGRGSKDEPLQLAGGGESGGQPRRLANNGEEEEKGQEDAPADTNIQGTRLLTHRRRRARRHPYLWVGAFGLSLWSVMLTSALPMYWPTFPCFLCVLFAALSSSAAPQEEVAWMSNIFMFLTYHVYRARDAGLSLPAVAASLWGTHTMFALYYLASVFEAICLGDTIPVLSASSTSCRWNIQTLIPLLIGVCSAAGLFFPCSLSFFCSLFVHTATAIHGYVVTEHSLRFMLSRLALVVSFQAVYYFNAPLDSLSVVAVLSFLLIWMREHISPECLLPDLTLFNREAFETFVSWASTLYGDHMQSRLETLGLLEALSIEVQAPETQKDPPSERKRTRDRRRHLPTASRKKFKATAHKQSHTRYSTGGVIATKSAGPAAAAVESSCSLRPIQRPELKSAKPHETASVPTLPPSEPEYTIRVIRLLLLIALYLFGMLWWLILL